MNTNVKGPKQLRAEIRQRRRQLSHQQQAQATEQVNQRLATLDRIANAQHIALFLPFDGELNTQPIIETFWQQDKQVYLPILHPFSPGHLLFQRYTPDSPLIIHPFGMPQLQLDVRQVIPFANLDIVFTPLVAFDTQGNRLGMGGGFYDRTLKNWQQHNVYPIGLAHDCQQVEQLEKQAWDVVLPEVITPTKHWRFGV